MRGIDGGEVGGVVSPDAGAGAGVDGGDAEDDGPDVGVVVVFPGVAEPAAPGAFTVGFERCPLELGGAG